jgi:hypothetical protein
LAAPTPTPRLLRLLFIVALAGYALFLAAHSTSVAGGSDSSGYLNSARLLASGRLHGELRVPAEFGPQSELDRMQFTPFGFFPYLEPPALPPTYPVGLPLHFAAASKLLGWHLGPLSVEIGGALAAIILLYLIARELELRPVLAAAGAAMLGACPIFIFTSIQPLSDTLATTWTLAAVLPALRARRHRGWAAVCGAAFAIAVLVRPTNAVLLPALVVFLGLDWRRLALLVVGGLPGAAWFGYYNHTLYGGPLRSGYGPIHETFDAAFIPGALVDFARWLALLLPAVLLILPLALPFAREVRNRLLVGLALWFGAVIAFFGCVAFSHESWWSLRYILPAVPALLLAALLGLEAVARRFPVSQRPALLNAAAGFLALWTIIGSAYWTRKLAVYYVKDYEQAYADSARAAFHTFPKESLVVSAATCGALYAYTDFHILRGEQLDPARFAHFATRAHAAGRPICALLFDVEEKDILRERCPGEWQRVASVRNLGLWRLTPPVAVASPGLAR